MRQVLSNTKNLSCLGMVFSGIHAGMFISGATTSPYATDVDLPTQCADVAESPQNILLVDRNCVTRLGLRQIFRRAEGLNVVAEAGSAMEATELHTRHQPHIVILDTCLPDRDGIELAREFLHSRSRVLIFSHCNSDEDVIRAYSARVHGFVAKSSSQEELLHAVRLLKAGRACFPSGLNHKLRERSCQAHLSSREISVLRLVSKGLSNKEIAHQLNVSEATAKTFLTRTMKKLGVHDRTQAVMTAMERGWMGRDH